MIIEFVGPPGAGKSELKKMAMKILPELGFQALTYYEARVLCLKRAPLGKLIEACAPQKWREKIHSSVSRRLLMLNRVAFAIKNYQLMRIAIGQLRHRTIPFEEKRMIWEFFLRDCSFYQFFRKRLEQSEALVLSEGLLHRLTSLHSSADEEPNVEEILSYIKIIPKPDLLISVNTSTKKCAERVISRREYRRYLDKKLAHYIQNSKRTLEIALQGIRQIGWNCIEVNNDAALQKTGMNFYTILSDNFAHQCKEKSEVESSVQR